MISFVRFILVSVFVVTLSPRGADYFPPPDSEGGWRSAKTTEEIRANAGMDAAKLEQAFDFTSRCSQNGGLLVVRHGWQRDVKSNACSNLAASMPALARISS